jgi:micrococcal nuclease
MYSLLRLLVARTPLFHLLAYLLVFQSSIVGDLLAEERTPILVRKVIDGDTIEAEIHGARQRVRLIGLDTPESHDNKRARAITDRYNTPIADILADGIAATHYTRALFEGACPCTIEFDVDRHDRYGRLLGYIYDKSSQMINEKILSDGYAYLLTVPPNVRYVARFKRAFGEARERRRGLWR